MYKTYSFSSPSIHSSGHRPHLHSFPTRRSSDLQGQGHGLLQPPLNDAHPPACGFVVGLDAFGFGHLSEPSFDLEDRKSTRLNSSHVAISYAVFCLKKKKITKLSAAAYQSIQSLK